jgi:menaquinone-9 beta-reductase
MVYDLITVGGGLGGAAVGGALASAGARVLIVERERAFKDRVRGEGLLPWGAPEAHALGLDETLAHIGHRVRYWSFGAPAYERRDLVETTPARAPCTNIYHPALQETLLARASGAGAEVRRGVSVAGVAPGTPASVTLRHGGRAETLRARLVVGADGRQSRARSWGGFQVQRDPEQLVIAGVLLERLDAPQDTVSYIWSPPRGAALIFPLGQDRFRCYLGYPKPIRPRPLSGEQSLPEFVAACVEIGAPAGWYAGAGAAGPLASFDGADSWVEHPYRDGVALIGDAAAASDPNWGCGLALTLRDARVLAECLLADEEWDRAAHAYAAEHDRYYGALHRIERWMTDLYFALGPEADARRARVFPLLQREPERSPDIIGRGPEAPSDEAARRCLYGEE